MSLNKGKLVMPIAKAVENGVVGGRMTGLVIDGFSMTTSLTSRKNNISEPRLGRKDSSDRNDVL